MENVNKKKHIKTSLFPFLVVKDAAGAIEFYTAGLGAVLEKKYGQPGEKVMAKLEIDGCVFWIGDEEPECDNHSPQTVGGSPVRIVLIVADPHAVFKSALEHGARQICPVTLEESWLIGKLADPSGHIWEIGHPLEGE